MPAEIKRAAEQRKRDEQEMLEKAEHEGKKLGNYTPSTIKLNKTGTTDDTTTPVETTPTETNPTNNNDTRPVNTPRPDDRPTIKQGNPPPQKKDPQPEKPEGTTRKGKKGDG
jgi:hypothetical protein